ncbi:MAG TPA: L-histidine N(alpha)-methyltransferase [Candidatus Omnitrophota bacterium]|nr:L-histidine N(alpha)-methyltransferase [Candidatus Omnitrophota bacterium]
MKRDGNDDGFREAVLDGLTRRPRRIPCRFLYDAVGSALFERITELPDYHLTRAETALLARHGPAIAASVGAGVTVVEYGAGSMRKTRLLLAELDRPSAYVPVDVSQDFLVQSARRLGADLSDLPVVPLVADFTKPLTLPPPAQGPVLVFFPGSTIGNLRPAEARDLMVRSARLAGPGGWLLVGVDPVRDAARLHRAYDDPQGITATFTRNLLARANRELGADFDLDCFDHAAWWNAREGRVEISLVANRRQQVAVAGHPFAFRSGESIHVEDCYKYSVEQFQWLARQSGFEPVSCWADEDFSLHLLKSPACG